MTVSLTRVERRVIWISSALLLLILVCLFFFGLFLDVRIDNPFLPGFYWIANVVAASAAGILASTISGFFKLKLERKFGRKGRFFLQATGGFAVFVIVIIINPRSQMFQLADTLFANLIQDCKQSISDPQSYPNGRALCEKVAQQYPNRPEPWRYLGTWTHRNKPTVQGFGEAAGYYEKSVNLYGYHTGSRDLHSPMTDLSDYDRIGMSEALLGYAFSNADHALSEYGTVTHEESLLASNLENSDLAFDYALTLAGDQADPILKAKALDGRGKIDLYRFCILDAGEASLKAALNYYDEAINLNTRYSMFLKYHKFITILLLNGYEGQSSQIQDEQETSSFDSFLSDWDIYMDNQYNAKYEPRIKEMMRQILDNRREELYVITRPFGSKKYGGSEFSAFLARHPDMKQRLADLVKV